MFSLRCANNTLLLLRSGAARALPRTTAIKPLTTSPTLSLTPTRSLTLLTPLRPTLLPSHRSPLFLAPSGEQTSQPSLEQQQSAPPDLLPRITTHPALRFLQVRNGPRNTFSPSHFVRKRRFGFLARLRCRTGRAILKRRRAKGRKALSH